MGSLEKVMYTQECFAIMFFGKNLLYWIHVSNFLSL